MITTAMATMATVDAATITRILLPCGLPSKRKGRVVEFGLGHPSAGESLVENQIAG